VELVYFWQSHLQQHMGEYELQVGSKKVANVFLAESARTSTWLCC